MSRSPMTTSTRPPKNRILPSKRGPGRPTLRINGSMSKIDIVKCALELAKLEPLQSISIVRVAAELGVTPALIHYYVGGRDRLTSGVMNSFYSLLTTAIPLPTPDWRAELTTVFDTIYKTYIAYGGIV